MKTKKLSRKLKHVNFSCKIFKRKLTCSAANLVTSRETKEKKSRWNPLMRVKYERSEKACWKPAMREIRSNLSPCVSWRAELSVRHFGLFRNCIYRIRAVFVFMCFLDILYFCCLLNHCKLSVRFFDFFRKCFYCFRAVFVIKYN